MTVNAITHHPLRVLLVEDHYALAETIYSFLEIKNYVVDHASTGASALGLIKDHSYDCIVLDVNLPDMSGYQVCEQLRHEYSLSTPIIMLTARDSLEDKLTGFNSGTDDYLTKPIDLAELCARIEANCRRAKGLVGNPVLKVADLEYNLQSHQVLRQGKEITLSPILLSILSVLMRASPNIVSRADLQFEIWGDDVPESNALKSHLFTLKQKIDKPFEKALIHTIRHQGVKITAE